MFRPFPFRKRKSPELLEREAVGGFGTCCFRMPLLFRCDFYPSRGRLKPIRQVGRCSIRLPLNHYRRGLSFPPLFLPAERFLTPSSARIREDAKAHRHESPFSPLYRLPFCECEKRSAERSGVQRRSLWQDTTPVVRQVSSCKEKPLSWLLSIRSARKKYWGTLAFQIFMESFEKGVGKRKAVWLKWKA